MTAQHTRTDILDDFRSEGWKLLKVDPKTKSGVGEEWQNRDVSVEAVRDYIQQGGGVGIQMGEPSCWLSVLDGDHKYAIATAPAFLPETLRQAKGSEVSHYFYYCEGLGYEQFNDLNGKRLIDIKASNNGAGHLVVVEPTEHLHKGPYQFVGGFNPAAIAHVHADELRRRLRLWACSTLIAVHLPLTREEGEGGRHDLSKAIAGFGLRNGWTEEEATKVQVEAWKARKAPREAVRNVERNVADTAEKLRRDEPATGGCTLEELIPGLAGRIAKFMKWERADKRDGKRHYPRSDLGNAERFIDQHGSRVRWCPERSRFMVWDGKRWLYDETGATVRLAQETSRTIFEEAAMTADKDEQRAIAQFALASQNTNRLNGMLAQAKPHLAVRMSELDADPLRFNVQNGTIDLRTKELKPHDPTDLITKISPTIYDPSADAPRFKEFLRETMVEEDVIEFLQRYCGYSLTGDTRERVLLILWGAGKNGKTTLIELLREVLGDYAKNTDVETILAKKYNGVGNDVAALKGARLISCAEVEQGRRLAEAKVKGLTGRDTVTARFLFCEPFDFRPEFKLWISTNNKPEIKGTDDAIWDRLRLLPFTERFDGERQDRTLPKKLQDELPGVLAWMVEGCAKWLAEGLTEPERVMAATKQYREEQDVYATFIADCCLVDKNAQVKFGDLYDAYEKWCDGAGEKPDSKKAFGMRLTERGFERDSIANNVKIRRGITLRSDYKPPNKSAKITDRSSKKAADAQETTSDNDEQPTARGGHDRSVITQNHCKPQESEEENYRSGSESNSKGQNPLAEQRIGETGNNGNNGNPNDAKTPLSADVQPGQSAMLSDLAEQRRLERADKLAEFLAKPPHWFVKQAQLCVDEGSPERLIQPLINSVATDVLGGINEWREADEPVRRRLEEMQAGADERKEEKGRKITWLT